MGKAALALNVVQHAAIEHNVSVAIFSLEMSKEQLVQRLLCSEGLVDAQRLRRGQLRDDDYPKLARAAGLLGTAPIWIDDSAMLSPLAMRSKARRLKAEHDVGLVVVDYLQMMQGPTDSESRQQEISFISRSLKALAKELDVPVVALSQLSRAPEQRGGEQQPKGGGRCEACGAWNTLVEEAVGRTGRRADRKHVVPSGSPPVRLSALGEGAGVRRWQTGLREFDFVLGGGIVPGSVVLVGGEPGIGKSTLLLQCAARLEQAGVPTLYVSGEESPDQIRLRAARLTVDAGAVHVLGETRLEAITHHAHALGASVVLVDSIQTTYTDELEGAPGNVGQVRECAARLVRFAKEAGPGGRPVGR